jgi:hypothetical protein
VPTRPLTRSAEITDRASRHSFVAESAADIWRLRRVRWEVLKIDRPPHAMTMAHALITIETRTS